MNIFMNNCPTDPGELAIFKAMAYTISMARLTLVAMQKATLQSLGRTLVIMMLSAGCCPGRELSTRPGPGQAAWGEILRCKYAFSENGLPSTHISVVTRTFRTESTDPDLCNIREICLSGNPTDTVALNVQITGDKSKFRLVGEELEPSGGALRFPETPLGLEPREFVYGLVSANILKTYSFAHYSTVISMPDDVRKGHAPITIRLPYWSNAGLQLLGDASDDSKMIQYAMEYPARYCTVRAWPMRNLPFQTGFVER